MSTKTIIRINVIVPKEFRTRVKLAALKEGVSMSQYITKAVEERMDHGENNI